MFMGKHLTEIIIYPTCYSKSLQNIEQKTTHWGVHIDNKNLPIQSILLVGG